MEPGAIDLTSMPEVEDVVKAFGLSIHYNVLPNSRWYKEKFLFYKIDKCVVMWNVIHSPNGKAISSDYNKELLKIIEGASHGG